MREKENYFLFFRIFFSLFNTNRLLILLSSLCNRARKKKTLPLDPLKKASRTGPPATAVGTVFEGSR